MSVDFVARLIQHDTLLASPAPHPWANIPYPLGSEPSVLGEKPSPELPKADVVLIAYTTDEGNALAAALTPGYLALPPDHNHKAWDSYDHLYPSYVPDLVKGSSPALFSKNLGLCKLIELGGKRVLCFKSSLHLARDGASMPIKRLVAQIVEETGCSLIVTTGTAGGIGAAVQLGDAAISTTVRWDCKGRFKKDSFNGQTLSTPFALRDPSFLAQAGPLIAANAQVLASSPIPPSRNPEIQAGTTVFGGEPNTVVTTDIFAYDDAADTFGLQGLGWVVEMDDAAVAMAVDGLPNVDWLSIRNASDPQMPAGATEKESSDIYTAYGFYTTLTSSIACWAVVMGL